MDKEMHGVSGVRSRNGDMFKYSAYWQSWSRILSPLNKTPFIGQVEVDLTEINHLSGHYWWSTVSQINIRAHRTCLAQADILTPTLPAEVFEAMKVRIPDTQLLDRLMHEDLMPLIDWDKYQKVCNGGAPLETIRQSSGSSPK